MRNRVPAALAGLALFTLCVGVPCALAAGPWIALGGRVWRTKTRPAEARRLATIDSHTPGRFRVDGSLSDLPEFAKAWNCKAGAPMVGPDSLRTRIW